MFKSYEPRIRSDTSLHSEYDPEKCPKTSTNPSVRSENRCGIARVVDCCGTAEDIDIEECSKCGLQRTSKCYFDEDNS